MELGWVLVEADGVIDFLEDLRRCESVRLICAFTANNRETLQILFRFRGEGMAND